MMNRHPKEDAHAQASSESGKPPPFPVLFHIQLWTNPIRPQLNVAKQRSAKKPSAPNQMPETVTTEILEDDLITLIEGSPEERDQCIQSIFEHLEEDAVGSLLGGFCIGDRETYNDDPIIMGVSFDDEISGTIDVAFTGSAYYGCKDMDRLDEHDETVTFTIDREASTVEFSTNPPDLPERPMDDI